MNTQAIIQDSIDKDDFNECRESAPKIQAMTQKTDALATVAELAADVFASFYQPAPQVEENIDPQYLLNKKLIERLSQSASYHHLREETVNDKLATTITTATITEKIIQTIPPELREEIARLQEVQEALENAEETEMPTLQAEQETLTAAIEEQVDEASGHIRAAMKDAQGEVNEFKTAMHGFSLAGEGKIDNLPLQGKLKLFQLLKANPKIQRVMQFAGRSIRIALNTQRQRTIHPPTTTIGIQLGNDLTKTLPSEFGYLADDDTEILFYLKFVEGTLLNYHQIGHENVGQGPIILACDESASMTNPVAELFGGVEKLTREEWSKGIALAMATIAKRQKRDFCLIHYASTGQQQVATFPKGEASIEEITATIQHFFNGGTDFSPMMTKAATLITSSQWDKADCIIISDGLTHIPPDDIAHWQKVKAERKFRSYGILIGTVQGQKLLQTICDSTFTLLDMFTEEETALKTIFSI
ncbi:MAG: hypothetical protein JST84_04755 [Acidobacteria bacterium]|nr:hypothetical protein [Acidobacteriota bacterium]